MDRPAMRLEAEVDGLQRLLTAGVGASRVAIDYVGRHKSFLAEPPVEGVHLFQIPARRPLWHS